MQHLTVLQFLLLAPPLCLSNFWQLGLNEEDVGLQARAGRGQQQKAAGGRNSNGAPGRGATLSPLCGPSLFGKL